LYRVLFQAIGIHVVGVNLIVFVITYQVTIVIFGRATRSLYSVSSMFPDLPSPVDVWQMAFTLAASTSVSVIGTFMNMTFRAACPLAAIAEHGKVFADRSGWIDTNVCIATCRVRTFTTKEMQASRYSLGSGFMR